MGRARVARQEKRAGGAFGRKREEPSERDERDEMDAFRAHVTEAVASVWSYAEIAEYGQKAQRDRERLEEIAELFDEAQGAAGKRVDLIEELCFAIYQNKLGEQRTARTLNHAARQRANAKQRARFHERYHSDETFRQDCIKRARANYERVRHDPELWRQMLARIAAWRGKHPEKTRLYWRRWRDKLRATNPEKWERVCERTRARDRQRIRNTPERREDERAWASKRRTQHARYKGLLPNSRVPEAYRAGCSVEEIQAAAGIDTHRVLALLDGLTKRRRRRTEQEIRTARAFLEALLKARAS